MINKKKERIKDIIANDSMVIVMYGELLLQSEADNNKPATPDAPSTSVPTSSLLQPTKRKTIMDIPLDAPKLFMFDSNNDYIQSASLRNKDKHALFSLPKSPVFCVTNEAADEMRVITKEGKRIHVLTTLKSLPIIKFDRYFLQGKNGTDNWTLYHPESGRVVPLNTLGAHDRLFVVEDPITGHFQGILGVNKDDKVLNYFEQVEQKATPALGEAVAVTAPAPIDQQQQQQANNSTSMSSNLVNRKLEKRWSAAFSWKASYLKFKLGGCRLYSSLNKQFFILTRTFEDSRRFLSGTKRYDMQIVAIDQQTGKTVWEKVHECFFNASDEEEVEKGFDLYLLQNKIIAASYILRVGKNEGFSSLSCYHLSTGALMYSNKTKRRPDISRALEERVSAAARNKKRATLLQTSTVVSNSKKDSVEIDNTATAPVKGSNTDTDNDMTSDLMTEPLSTPRGKRNSFDGAKPSSKLGVLRSGSKLRSDKDKCSVM